MLWGDKFRNETHKDGDKNREGGGQQPQPGPGGKPGGGGKQRNETRNDREKLPSVSNQQVAQFFMNSSELINAETEDMPLLTDFLDRLFNESLFATEISLYSNITSMILLALSILIVIPLVIIIFAISLKTSQQNQKKLQQVHAVMVLDTMRDPSQKQRFRNYCSGTSDLEHCFLFLESVSDFKELGSQSVQEQVDLFEKSKHYIENGKVTIEDQPSESEIMSILKSEKKLRKIEKKKQNLVFEIWSQYLEPYCEIRVIISRVSVSDVEYLVKEIDSFNNGLEEYQYFDLLPDDIFDELEKQVAKSISEDHHKFQEYNLNIPPISEEHEQLSPTEDSHRVHSVAIVV